MNASWVLNETVQVVTMKQSVYSTISFLITQVKIFVGCGAPTFTRPDIKRKQYVCEYCKQNIESQFKVTTSFKLITEMELFNRITLNNQTHHG